MKKIYLLLLITLGFVGHHKVLGQLCNKCIENTVCIPLTFNLDGCENVKVTLCVRCGVTNPRIYWFGVAFENICPGYEDQIQQYLNNWISNNTLEICGNRPCQEQPSFIVYFHKPLCGDVFWDGNRYHIYLSSQNCQNECLDEREWCWCNCIPGQCWDEECARRGGAPYFKYNHIRYLETNPGACDFVPYGNKCQGVDDRWRFKNGIPWEEPLQCVRILWEIDNCDSDCKD